MHPDSDSNEPTYISSPSSSKQDSSDDMKKVQRREKNRIAAQKSRQRQTQKADTLHVESENLERVNAALRREIRCLRDELKYLTCVLSSHQSVCALTPQKPVPFPAHAASSPATSTDSGDQYMNWEMKSLYNT